MSGKVLTVVGLLLASCLAASVLTWRRWGYFVTPPSGEHVVARAERVTAIHPYHVTRGGAVEVKARGRTLAEDPGSCQRFEVACLEGRLLGAAERLPGMPAPAPLPASALVPDLERACAGVPGEKWGVVMDLELASGPARLVACRSNDLGGDVHLYREVLLSSEGAKVLAAYRYEVAGLEVLTMPVVAVLLAVTGGLLLALGRLLRWFFQPALCRRASAPPG